MITRERWPKFEACFDNVVSPPTDCRSKGFYRLVQQGIGGWALAGPAHNM